MIELCGVRKSFGKLHALDGVSLQIARGERVALVGTNGSGKTTLLRAMCGLLAVQGKVLVDGVDPAHSPQRALQKVAYIPQLPPPLEAPVAELVRVYCALRGCSVARVEAHAAELGLMLPALRSTRMRDLSGGMKQKLLASLALASDAELYLCDEPTASLDKEARLALFAALAQRTGLTLVLCCHRLEEVRSLVDRVVEMKDGAIVRDEPLPALLAEVRPSVRTASPLRGLIQAG